jgi:2-methylcitrate dehydratase PrpD
MLDKLGTNYFSGGMLYKYWPAVGNAHTYIHAAIELMNENTIDLSEIKEVRVFVGDFQQRMCSPLELRQAPRTLVDAKFSLPFLVALSMVQRRLEIGDFSSVALKNPVVLELARKVVPVPDSSFDWTSKLPDGKVEVLMRDGRNIERRGSSVPGTAERPMTWDELCQKFLSCASAASNPVAPDRIAQAQDLARSLEKCRDVAELVRLVT